MTVADNFLYLAVFVIGVIIGRLTMAVQYAMMKGEAKKRKL